MITKVIASGPIAGTYESNLIIKNATKVCKANVKAIMVKMKILLFLLLQMQWLSVSHSNVEEKSPIALPHCSSYCGDVQIPYPFGIEPNCFHDTAFEIICDNSSSHPKPFLKNFNLEVMDINWPGRYSIRYLSYNQENKGQVLRVKSPTLNLCSGKHNNSINLTGSPYKFSTWYNVLVVEGCGGTVMLKNTGGHVLTGCASVCGDIVNATDCYGVGCCQGSFFSSSHGNRYMSEDDTASLDYYELDVESDGNLSSDHSCSLAATLSDSSSISNFSDRQSDPSVLPMVLEWRATYSSIDFQRDNVTCFSDGTCSCAYLHDGNPYLPNGCHVLKECRKCRTRHCVSRLAESGEYVFHCENPLLQLGPVLGFSLGTGTVLLLLFCYWLYRFIKRKREDKRKAMYFKRNGGLLLLQQHNTSSSDGALIQKTKIFRIIELEKATNKFNKNRILGQGGQGTVYKGMLIDGRIVAIKKSKQVDESQLEQFINEVVILSQINHRNVVKLLGCCLETEVPLLVYEFVPNGTLYQHINDHSEDFHFNWKLRLQIAAESADAVAYLHSSSSTPIYHRDIKSSNILLDEKYKAKVSDFGTSRAITIEQTHVTTCVLGTYGYLDPEYFQSHQFTEKSDVYSFGVVLVELITGKKPICPTNDGGWISLACEFLFHMENNRLHDILDKRIIEGKEEEFMSVAGLAKQCLNMNGKQRPTMKEVAVLLNGIKSTGKVSNVKQPYDVETQCVVTEIHQLDSCVFESSSSFSYDDPDTSRSLEVEPLMATLL